MEDNKEKYEHGFKAPEGYFDKFEDNLFNLLELEDLPKESGFKVPEGYFDGLENTILQKVKEEPKETKVIPLFRRRVVWYSASVAAAVALLFTFIYNPPVEGDEEDIPLAEIEAYIDQDIASFDSYDLAQVLTDEELEGLEIENNYLLDEDLEDYILDNLDDPTILIE